jgi:hypothetical protein
MSRTMPSRIVFTALFFRISQKDDKAPTSLSYTDKYTIARHSLNHFDFAVAFPGAAAFALGAEVAAAAFFVSFLFFPLIRSSKWSVCSAG